MIPEEYVAPYLISNIVSVGLVVTAITWPRLARGLFVFIFLAAGLFNAFTVLTEPEVYHDYREMAVLDIYKEFIAGFFSRHTKGIVLAIAAGQLCIAALILCRPNLRRLGIVGGCIFFVAIMPLGVGSAFPCTLLMAAALVQMECRLTKAVFPQPTTHNSTGNMKTLFFGAGPLGILYAHLLDESGADVTILARGEKFEHLKTRSLSLVNGFNGERAVPGFKVIDHLSKDDIYDLVVVLVRKNKIASVQETLSQCPNLVNILFMGNNVLGFEAYLSRLPRKKVLFGFPGAGGGWNDNSIEYVDSESPGAKRMPVRIGEIDGVERERTREIQGLFERGGVPVEVVADIDGWLKYHGAFVIPIGLGIYRHCCDLKALAGDRESLLLIVRAAKESGNVLKALGYTKRQPFKFNLFYWMPERVTAGIFRTLLESRYAEIAFGLHAGAAGDEFEELTEDLQALAAQTFVETPNLDILMRDLRGVPPV